ncbi:hypothetical protein ACFWFR_08525 [Oerskovia sp. NPDC060287]|uniref:hypothetical protein n=1 Tax=Oerskovia sp. NPDC060287 TaxID=3347095 RepID=UPI00365CE634
MPGTSNPTKNSSWVDKVADVHMKRMREIHGPKTGVMFDEPFATAMWRLWEQGMTRDAARGLARVVRGLRRGNRPLEAEVKHSVHQVARLARDGRVSRNDQARFATALTTLVVREVESADRKAEARRVRKAQPKVAVAAWQRERLRAMAAAQERRREVEISRASTTQQPVPAPLSRRQVQEWTRAEAEARVRLAARRARDEEAERLREESRRGAAEEFRARNPRPVSRHH